MHFHCITTFLFGAVCETMVKQHDCLLVPLSLSPSFYSCPSIIKCLSGNMQALCVILAPAGSFSLFLSHYFSFTLTLALSLYPSLLIVLLFFSSVLFSFPPLPRSLVPCHIDKERQNDMHSNHCHDGRIEVAVVAGVTQRRFKQICLCCKVQSNGKSYHQDGKKQKSLQYRYQ